MDPYHPPRTPEGADVVDEDEALGGPPAVVGLTGAVMGAAGLMAAAAGWQLGSMLISRHLLVEVWMWSFLPLGAALAVFGGGYTQARSWAVLPGVVVSGAVCLSAWGWLVYALLNGAFTMASAATAALSGLGVFLGGLTLRRARRVAEARAKLLAGE